MKYKKITAIIDTREQSPLDLSKYGLDVEVRGLEHGDYSLACPNLERTLSIERKSLPDFIACCGREHERFRRELLALRGYPYRFVVCEFSLTSVFSGEYRSKIDPECVIGCVSSWLGMGIPFLFCDNSEQASKIVAQLLIKKAHEVFDFVKSANNLEE